MSEDVPEASLLERVDVVWVIPSGNGTSKLHIFPDCVQFDRGTVADPVQKDPSVFPAASPDDVCSVCRERLNDDDAGVDADDRETCRHGDPWCRGESTMRAGQLPCLECLLGAPQAVVDEMNAKRRRSAANRPTVAASGGGPRA